tara:strand:- start:1000 stop:1755 length:756 start_codon:yes stop_codon:yes gene_type:complete
MRKKIVAGNWKMNLDKSSSEHLVKEILESTQEKKDIQIVLSPPFVYLEQIVKDCVSRPDVLIAAQNCSAYDNGAFTGEVSTNMLKSIGVDYVIIGHSERRQFFSESNDVLMNKISLSLSNNLKVIFCCGEDINQREKDLHFEIIEDQLKSTVFNLSANDFSKIVIAYEPIWAIGTGKTATSDQAQEIHGFIRSLITNNYNKDISDNTTILYGGSCKPSNAKAIFSEDDIDGGLIGGASLKSADFTSIISSI